MSQLTNYCLDFSSFRARDFLFIFAPCLELRMCALSLERTVEEERSVCEFSGKKLRWKFFSKSVPLFLSVKTIFFIVFAYFKENYEALKHNFDLEKSLFVPVCWQFCNPWSFPKKYCEIWLLWCFNTCVMGQIATDCFCFCAENCRKFLISEASYSFSKTIWSFQAIKHLIF